MRKMRKFLTLGQLTALGSACGLGWLIAQLQIYHNPSPAKNFPGLSLYAPISAATAQDMTLSTIKDEPSEPALNTSKISQVMRFGFPSLNNVRSLRDFVLSYDTRNKVPFWVFEHLTSESVARNEAVSREHCEFHEDKSIHPYFRSHNHDYKGSGFDRGHMAAAGNHKANQKFCEETFVLSNIAPQVGKGFNRDKWNDLESYCRKLTKVYKNVYVCTGPLYLPRKEMDGKLYVKYQVIGSNHVAVPTHFYKVIVCESDSGNLDMETFLLPNEVIDNSVSLATFHVDLEVIERASGLIFFDKINRAKLSKINGLKIGWL